MRFEALVLLCKPGTVRLLELRFAMRQRFDVVRCLQLGKLLRRHDDSVNAPVFFNKHRLSFGLGAYGAKSIFGLSGCDLHEISRRLNGYFS